MRKSKQLIGTEIVDKKTGKLMGTVKDVIYMPGEKKILGFIVNCGKWIKGSRVLFPGDIDHIGKDVVLVKQNEVLETLDKLPRYNEAIREKDRVFSLRVITDRGQELGYIEDIIVDEEDCTIGGYVLTDGITEDILKGKLILPFYDNIVFGEYAVIVENSTMGMMLINDISFKRVFKKAEDDGDQ